MPLGTTKCRECGRERAALASTPEAQGTQTWNTEQTPQPGRSLKPQYHRPTALAPAGEVGIRTLGHDLCQWPRGRTEN